MYFTLARKDAGKKDREVLDQDHKWETCLRCVYMAPARRPSKPHEIENVIWRERFIKVDEIHRIDSKHEPCRTLGD